VEEMLVSHGVDVTYESIRQWCLGFGAEYAKRIRARAGRRVTPGISTIGVSCEREKGWIGGMVCLMWPTI